MNYNSLKEEFKIRFFTKESPQCFFCGMPLFLLGDFTPEISLTTTLSVGTALLYTPNNIAEFAVQNADTNISYICESRKMATYHGKDFAKDIFRSLSLFCGDIPFNGANLFFSDNVGGEFQNTLGALCLFLSYILHIPSVEIAKKISAVIDDSCFATLAVADLKNHVCIREKSDCRNYPLPLHGYKIVIVTADIKKAYFANKVANVFENPTVSENVVFSDITSDMLSETDYKILKFCVNERRRIYNYKKNLSSAELFRLIGESTEELMSFSESKRLAELTEAVRLSKRASAYRPTFDFSALYCITADNSVDEFIEKTEAVYEKKAGFKPTFYICDTASNGIIR